MGQFLSFLSIEINDNYIKPQSCLKNLLNNQLCKLIEYYGSFKSICDTFSIDESEYEEIFETEEKYQNTFEIWNTKKNGLIDALELFTCLTIFSDDNFKDKVEFLYNIYDFNEVNSLAMIDLEFMLINCVNSVYKVYAIDRAADELEIRDFLKQNFNDDARFNIALIQNWFSNSKEVYDFITIIKKKLPEGYKNEKEQNGVMKFQNKEQLISKSKIKQKKSLLNIINSNQHQQMIDWITKVNKKLIIQNPNQNASSKDLQCKINWVFGFNSFNVKKPIQYVMHDDQERILYFTANIHYVEHDEPIQSICVASNQILVASGELAPIPSIHMWNCKNLQNIGIIKGIHQHGIDQIVFFNNDQLIASCGIRFDTPILVYSTKDFTLIHSTFTDQTALCLITVFNFVGTFYQKNEQNNISTNSENYEEQFKYQLYQQNFIVCTKRKVLFYHYNGQLIEKDEIILDPNIADITTAVAVRLNHNNPYLKAYCDLQDIQMIIITGHSDGSVYSWVNLNFNQANLIEKYTKEKIVNISNFEFGIVIATSSAKITFIDFTFKKVLKAIDLCDTNYKLVDYNIADVLVTESKLLISTILGDIVEIQFNQQLIWQENQYNLKISSNKINYIYYLEGDLKAMCLLYRPQKEDTYLYASGSKMIVYGFSLETHELIDKWSMGGSSKITCMACINSKSGKFIIVSGAEDGKIYMRIDWEEQPIVADFEKPINEICFSNDGEKMIVAVDDTTKNNIFIFTWANEKQFSIKTEKLLFENEIPLSIEFLDNDLSFIVATQLLNIYKITFSDLSKPINLLQDQEKLNCTSMNIKYTQKAKKKEILMHLLLGKDRKVNLVGLEGGAIYYWRDLGQLETNCGGYLMGHSSSLSKIQMKTSQDFFYSVGLHDNTIIEWKVDFINDFNDFSMPFFQHSLYQPQNANLDKQFSLKDEVLIRELEYCQANKANYINDSLRDQFTLFRGVNFRGVNQKNMHQNLQQQLDYIEDNNFFSKRAPQISLDLDFIYGNQTFEKRSTVYYAHKYEYHHDSQKHIKNSQYDDILNKLSKSRKILLEQNEKEIELSSQLYKSPVYSEFHQECERNIVFFTSRIGIVYNPVTNKQKFYEGHGNKITCIAIHPLKFYIATGEASASPKIHIWRTINCEIMKIIPTAHKNGIIKLSFSKDCQLIISVGMDTFFSIQVTNWKSEEIQLFRNCGQYPIFDASFNPYDRNEFATIGSQFVTIWNFNGKNIHRKYNINVAEDSANTHGSNITLTCLAYISYNLQLQVSSDIILGNNYGDIVLVSNGKFLIVYPNAHNKMINCIKIVQAFDDNIIIITAGNDEMIHIWDTNFNKINSIQLRSLIFCEHYKTISKNKHDQENISAQSLDVYICVKENKTIICKENKKLQHLERKSFPKILIGTRNGDILEATFTLDLSILKKKIKDNQKYGIELEKTKNMLKKQMAQQHESEDSEEEKNRLHQQFKFYGQSDIGFKFEYQLHLRSHSSQMFRQQKASQNLQNNKIFFALHPIEPCMVSVGEDQILFIYNTNINKVITTQYLGLTPTSIKFQNIKDEFYLFIGFVNGEIRIFHFSFEQLMKKSKEQLTQQLKQHSTLQDKDRENKIGTAVLNMEFSPKGEILAVSYDVARSSKEFEGKLEKEGSYISVFSNNPQIKAKQANKSQDLLYIQLFSIRCPSTYESISTESNIYGCAVYFMTFDIEQRYLLVFYQLVDNSYVRANHLTQQGWYCIWDVQKKTQIKSSDQISNIIWKSYNFPNSLIAKYKYLNNLISTDKSEDKEAQIPNLVPYLSITLDLRNIAIPYLINGSVKGDLHIVQNSCLVQQNDNLNVENVKDSQMCLAKTYSAHISFVNQCEMRNIPETLENYQNNYKETNQKLIKKDGSELKKDNLFTTGIHDQCIMKWKFIHECNNWDLDNEYHPMNYQDPVTLQLKEMIRKDEFQALQNDVLSIRNKIVEVNSKINQGSELQIDLVLQNIIGRNARNKRNNLKYDHEENIMYVAGCNLVVANPREEEMDEYFFNRIQQEFLVLDDSKDSIYPEISCFSMSLDKRFLVAGTTQINARLLLWDICSRSCLKNISLRRCSTIILAKLAKDNRHVACVALKDDFTYAVYLIDTSNTIILGCANFPYTVPIKIKDMEFCPQSIHKFVICGIHYVTFWSYKGGVLSYENLEIVETLTEEVKKQNSQKENADNNKEEQQEKEEDKQEEDEEQNRQQLKVVFICVAFIENMLIAGGDDGYIYIWRDKKIVLRQEVKQKQRIPVLCLATEDNSNIFVSGGLDGRVSLWSIEPTEIDFKLRKFMVFSLTHEQTQDAVLYSRNHIQSICIGRKYILVGSKNGDVYEIVKPEFRQGAQKEDKGAFKNQDDVQEIYDQNILRVASADLEPPCSIEFSRNSDLIFTLTKSGIFCVWDVKTLKAKYGFNFEKKSHSLIVCKNTPKIFVAFETEVIVLNADDPKYNQIWTNLEFNRPISDIKMCSTETFLGIALKPVELEKDSPDKYSSIYIYQPMDELGKLEIRGDMLNFLFEIKYIDFTFDPIYMLIRPADLKDEVVLFDLKSVKNMKDLNADENNIYVDSDIEWQQNGNIYSKKTKGLNNFYKDNNILKIAPFADSLLIVTDTIGTIRVFNHPINKDSKGPFQCYNFHLNQITQCVVSPDNNYLITSSEVDRCIFIWKIIKTKEMEEKIRRETENIFY